MAPNRFKRRARVRLRLSERARVTVRIERRTRSGWSHVGTFERSRPRGSSSFRLPLRLTFRGRVRTVRAGAHRLKLRARDGAGNRSRQSIRRFRLLR